MKFVRLFCCLALGLTVAWTCGFDTSLREYLDVRFWQPFVKSASHFAKPRAEGALVPYAGMHAVEGQSSLANLRAAYQRIAFPDSGEYDGPRLQRALEEARRSKGISDREHEEIDLIDAKIDMRAGSRDLPEPLHRARGKLTEFLRKAKSPDFLSEARGWLAHVHYQLGEQTAAGKIYLDELNRPDSNLSRQTLLNSLKMTYGYDGGPKLLKDLEQYFDSPEHASFAIQLITNPGSDRPNWRDEDNPPRRAMESLPPYDRIKTLLERHGQLLRSENGARALALLSMRTALRAGDPAAALRIAANVPARASIRSEPDFLWMLASARFLARSYAGAEQPLLRLFRSRRASDNQKSAAAYGLCGVYRKTGNPVEQIRYALWLYSHVQKSGMYLAAESMIEDQSVYWAVSGWDLNALLDMEASIEDLRSFLDKYAGVPDVRLVKYSLAVRLTRENQYEEAAGIYQEIRALPRARRMRQLAELYTGSTRSDATDEQRFEARYKLAEFIAVHPDGIYFNDALWHGIQRYALFASTDSRLTRAERRQLIEWERSLKDDQEERWRAYGILRSIMHDSNDAELRRKAAKLAIRCVRGINTERFGRADEVTAADIELSSWLRRGGRNRL
jgi:hypothetical protein